MLMVLEPVQTTAQREAPVTRECQLYTHHCRETEGKEGRGAWRDSKGSNRALLSLMTQDYPEGLGSGHRPSACVTWGHRRWKWSISCLLHAFAIDIASHDPLSHVTQWRLSAGLFSLWTKHSHHSETEDHNSRSQLGGSQLKGSGVHLQKRCLSGLEHLCAGQFMAVLLLLPNASAHRVLPEEYSCGLMLKWSLQ